MKIYKLLILSFIFCFAGQASAQRQGGRGHGRRPDRTEWLEKMKQFKHEYLTRELGLSEKQQEEFFPLYDAKEEERFKAERAVRRAEKELADKGENATDEDLDKSINDQYALDIRIAEIEKKYLAKFRTVLSRRQLFKLRRVERDFQRTLMEKRQGCPPPRK